MNSVILIGRLTRDPELRYTSGSQMAVATFTLAIDRPTRNGGERQADFPRVTVFGRQAETCAQYLKKGSQAAVNGRLQTGSYQNKNGDTVYTTDVIANRVEFLGSSAGGNRGGSSGGSNMGSGFDSGNNYNRGNGGYNQGNNRPAQQDPWGAANDDIPPGFEETTDDLPWNK